VGAWPCCLFLIAVHGGCYERRTLDVAKRAGVEDLFIASCSIHIALPYVAFIASNLRARQLRLPSPSHQLAFVASINTESSLMSGLSNGHRDDWSFTVGGEASVVRARSSSSRSLQFCSIASSLVLPIPPSFLLIFFRPLFLSPSLISLILVAQSSPAACPWCLCTVVV
jgi:hypothetical protein